MYNGKHKYEGAESENQKVLYYVLCNVDHPIWNFPYLLLVTFYLNNHLFAQDEKATNDNIGILSCAIIEKHMDTLREI